MKAKAKDYRARAARCEERARRERDPENREWQLILARAYRMLAEAASETAKQSPSRPLQPIRKDLMIRFRHDSSDGGDYGDTREVCEDICCAAER